MTRVGVTGHQKLLEGEAWSWVALQMKSELGRLPPPLVGITSLAIGADQLFAQTVLRVGGSIEVVIPFLTYINTFVESDKDRFEYLRNLSTRTEVLDRTGSDEECYLAAGKRVVDLSDILLAVWNAKPAQGPGGTADIVHYAMHKALPVVHINPINQTVRKLVGRTWNRC
jgi:hypothetical protein